MLKLVVSNELGLKGASCSSRGVDGGVSKDELTLALVSLATIFLLYKLNGCDIWANSKDSSHAAELGTRCRYRMTLDGEV